jgi:hypothetical protein
VLFSREEVAAFIARNFEAAWESVRPVPILRIDFGNGHVSTRTLHGNVASYVCTGEGQVMDILPGIYTPAGYTTALEPPRALAIGVSRLEAAPRQARLREYHRQRAGALRNLQQLVNAQPAGGQPGRVGNGPINRDRGKDVIERRVEQVVVIPGLTNGANAAPGPMPRTAAELANWAPLAADTVRNETQQRLLIHERFVAADPVRPEQIKRWVYRDVLHADLDDPYLGLGDDFFTDLER